MMSRLFSLSMMTAVAASCGAGSGGSKGGAGGVETVKASVEITAPEDQGFNLLAAAAFNSASVTGCRSGYQISDLSDSDTAIDLLVGDADCRYKVGTFTVGGDSFTIPSSYNFSQGTEFLVSGTASGKVLRLKVSSQLPQFPNAIAADPAPSVAMSLSFFERGDDETATLATAAAGVDVQVEDPIALEISVSAAQIDTTTGGTALSLHMNCNEIVGADEKCGAHDLNDMIAKMDLRSNHAAMFDTNASAADKLTACLALAQAGNGADGILTQASAVASAPNGGLQLDLLGPGPAFSPGNDQLVLAITADDLSGADRSCKYFAITIDNPLN